MKCINKLSNVITKKNLCQSTKFLNRLTYNFCTNMSNDKTEYPDIIKYFFDFNIKHKKLPCFEVYSSQIEILNQPMDFYLAIIVSIFYSNNSYS
jgi:hypothetical protein